MVEQENISPLAAGMEWGHSDCQTENRFYMTSGGRNGESLND